MEHSPDPPLLIGTAGWTIPREEAGEFPGQGTHLQRYAARLTAAEINTSFYRPHRASTYERWANSVPEGFRFSVKMPKEITHSARLKEVEALIACQDEIGRRLRLPVFASGDWAPDVVTHLGGDRYRVDSFVDEMRDEDVVRRTHFTCSAVLMDEDEWRINTLDILP